MAAAPVSYTPRGPAVVVRIERPERRNAVDGATADALLAAFNRFVADDAARVLVLTGDSQAFCAGADLKAIRTLRDRDEGPLGITRLFSPKPTIAAVAGYCVAGGLELALWCDLRIAATTAVFGCFERRFGVPLVDGGTQRLPRVVGMGRALELILLGRPVVADEALRIGLVNRVVPPGEEVDAACEWANLLASFPQDTMLADREAALRGAGLPLEEGLALERRLGWPTVTTGHRGAARFAAGEGRSGARVDEPSDQ
ncbi:MAG TPA: crotonase/enoyl-CoA hydratase family protein [Candidatus Limnocylindria bacterium]|nr:crotonase/enoyl-CoA hydratase family protein [Candidatus Limnocylindria bacterium]